MTTLPTPTPVLEVRQLHKTFVSGFFRKKVEAVAGVSFAVEPGEIFGLIGPNGAGKTTIIKMLTGLIFPSQGEASLFGQSVTNPQTRQALGYLPESPYFYEHLTPRELLGYYGRLFGLDGATLRKRTTELLELVGMTEAADRRIGKFSKGMRQRTGIAQALINDPQLVILDEPQSGLDPVGRHEVRNIILTLRERGKTVFFTSHVLPDVEAVCDRVAVLHKGRLIEMGRMHELRSQRQTGFELWLSDLASTAFQDWPHPPLRHELRGSVHVLTFGADADPTEAVSRAMAQGARLQALVPREENLEAIFMRDIGHAATPATE